MTAGPGSLSEIELDAWHAREDAKNAMNRNQFAVLASS
jgi:hypothetical protein